MIGCIGGMKSILEATRSLIQLSENQGSIYFLKQRIQFYSKQSDFAASRMDFASPTQPTVKFCFHCLSRLDRVHSKVRNLFFRNENLFVF